MDNIAEDEQTRKTLYKAIDLIRRLQALRDDIIACETLTLDELRQVVSGVYTLDKAFYDLAYIFNQDALDESITFHDDGSSSMTFEV